MTDDRMTQNQDEAHNNMETTCVSVVDKQLNVGIYPYNDKQKSGNW
jgi:hypothetical protein